MNWELGDIKEVYYCNLVRCDQEFDYVIKCPIFLEIQIISS